MGKLVLVSALTATAAIASPHQWGEKEALTVLCDAARPPRDRVKAARRLEVLRARGAVGPMILQLGRREESQEVLQAIRDALVGLGAVGALDAELADPTSPEELRAHAVATLAKLGERASVRRAARDPSARVRKEALNGLALHPAADDVEVALGALGDANAEVRQSAAMVLAQSGSRTALPRLRAARALESDPFVIYFFDKALKRIERASN